MTNWLVKLVEGSTRKFLDVLHICGQYYQLNPGYLEKLQRSINERVTYQIRLGVIDSVEGSEAPLQAPFILLLITKTGLTVSLLGGLNETGRGQIVGVWPSQFKDVVETNPEAITNLLYLMVERPELVTMLHLLF